MFKELAVGCGILSLLVAGGFLIKLVFFPVNTAQKMVGIAYDAQDEVLNADNAIYNYEWFKQKKEDIEAGRKQLGNARAQADQFKVEAGVRSEWTFEDKTESARLNSVVLGLENHLETMIADYNARARMATRNIFQDGVLPNYIDALTFIGRSQ